jgi:hypothetical protein
MCRTFVTIKRLKIKRIVSVLALVGFIPAPLNAYAFAIGGWYGRVSSRCFATIDLLTRFSGPGYMKVFNGTAEGA